MKNISHKSFRAFHVLPRVLSTPSGKRGPYEPFHVTVRYLARNRSGLRNVIACDDYAEAVQAMSPDELEAECHKRNIECACDAPADCVAHLLASIFPGVELPGGHDAPEAPSEEDTVEEDPEGDSNDYVLLEAAYSEDRYHDVLKLVNRLDPEYAGTKAKDEIYEHAEILLELAFGAPIDDEEE